MAAFSGDAWDSNAFSPDAFDLEIVAVADKAFSGTGFARDTAFSGTAFAFGVGIIVPPPPPPPPPIVQPPGGYGVGDALPDEGLSEAELEREDEEMIEIILMLSRIL